MSHDPAIGGYRDSTEVREKYSGRTDFEYADNVLLGVRVFEDNDVAKDVNRSQDEQTQLLNDFLRYFRIIQTQDGYVAFCTKYLKGNGKSRVFLGQEKLSVGASLDGHLNDKSSDIRKTLALCLQTPQSH